MYTSSILLNRLTARAKLRHIQALVRLVDLRNMGRAAEAIGVSQPAMSQIVADLERLLETQLFLRHARGVEPTPVALDLASMARRIMTAVEDGSEMVVSRLTTESRFIRAACTGPAFEGVLRHALPRYSASHPSTRLQLDEVIGHSLDTSFSTGDYDVIFCRRKAVDEGQWAFVPLAEDRLVLVMAAAHPLAATERVSDEDLRRAVWMPNHVATVAREAFEQMVAQRGWGVVEQRHVFSRSPQIVRAMLRGSHMLSLMPASIAATWAEDGIVVTREIDGLMHLETLGLYWQPARASDTIKIFVGFLKSARSAPHEEADQRG